MEFDGAGKDIERLDSALVVNIRLSAVGRSKNRFDSLQRCGINKPRTEEDVKGRTWLGDVKAMGIAGAIIVLYAAEVDDLPRRQYCLSIDLGSLGC
jgi:hypothetical protein